LGFFFADFVVIKIQESRPLEAHLVVEIKLKNANGMPHHFVNGWVLGEIPVRL